MLKKENSFKTNQIVFLIVSDRITSGQIRFIRHLKDDVKGVDGKTIVRSIMNTEYFIDGVWYKESQLKESAEELL
jgi:hypothetical protein